MHKYIFACTLLLVVISQELRKGLVRDRDPHSRPSHATCSHHGDDDDDDDCVADAIKRERLRLTPKGTFVI